MTALPRCVHTELPRLLCGCPEHHEWAFEWDDLTNSERDLLEGRVQVPATPVRHRRMSDLLADTPSRAWASVKPSGRILPDNRSEPSNRAVIVNCHGHTDTGLCPDCAADFRAVLTDVPLLLDDLDVAIAGMTRFVEHGTPNDDQSGRGGHPAVAALARLVAALRPAWDWFDARDPARLATALAVNLDMLLSEPALPNVARDVSSAAARARRVIDPAVEWWPYGPCPDCGIDIWQERITGGSDTPVGCRCGYTAPLDVHQRRLLDRAADRLLTVDELVGALEWDGRLVTRGVINGWIRRGRLLPRGHRMRWANGTVLQGAAQYRLGDAIGLARTRRAAS